MTYRSSVPLRDVFVRRVLWNMPRVDPTLVKKEKEINNEIHK